MRLLTASTACRMRSTSLETGTAVLSVALAVPGAGLGTGAGVPRITITFAPSCKPWGASSFESTLPLHTSLSGAVAAPECRGAKLSYYLERVPLRKQHAVLGTCSMPHSLEKSRAYLRGSLTASAYALMCDLIDTMTTGYAHLSNWPCALEAAPLFECCHQGRCCPTGCQQYRHAWSLLYTGALV